jgi:hypothetical protein
VEAEPADYTNTLPMQDLEDDSSDYEPITPTPQNEREATKEKAQKQTY